MRRTTESQLLPVLLVVFLAGALPALALEESAAPPSAPRLLQYHCALPACHGGPNPAQGMRLDAASLYRSTVNVRARTDGRFLRVSPGAPDQSLLYLKLLSPHQGGYRGPRMPLGMTPLDDEEIAVVRAWIESFPEEIWGKPPSAEVVPAALRSFQDMYLVNLPTPDALGRRTLEFRIAHRFKAAAVDAGSHGLYGLDSGAWIALELAYGVTDNLEMGLRRTNLETDYEGYVKWVLARQEKGGLPVSGALRASFSNVREPDRWNRERWALQETLARRIGESLSVMLVPTYVGHTNGLNPDDDRGTFAIGAGAEWRVSPRYAVVGEWNVQTAGVKAPFQGASVGFSMATSRHVFQILATNTQGTLTDLVAPGGDLDIRDSKFRLGFTISRTHGFN